MHPGVSIPSLHPHPQQLGSNWAGHFWLLNISLGSSTAAKYFLLVSWNWGRAEGMCGWQKGMWAQRCLGNLHKPHFLRFEGLGRVSTWNILGWLQVAKLFLWWRFDVVPADSRAVNDQLIVYFCDHHKQREAEGLGFPQTNKSGLCLPCKKVSDNQQMQQLQPGSSRRSLVPTGDGWNCWIIPWSGEPA